MLKIFRRYLSIYCTYFNVMCEAEIGLRHIYSQQKTFNYSSIENQINNNSGISIWPLKLSIQIVESDIPQKRIPFQGNPREVEKRIFSKYTCEVLSIFAVQVSVLHILTIHQYFCPQGQAYHMSSNIGADRAFFLRLREVAQASTGCRTN